jgi:hypothetical protein
MQHIDPYSDDFFKKAAEDYPLKTGAGEWENVAKKLGALEAANKTVNKRNYKNISRRFVLAGALLLIPFAIAVTKYIYINTGFDNVANAGIKNKQVESLSANTVKVLSDARSNGMINNTVFANIQKSIFYKSDVEKNQEGYGELSSPNEIEKQNNLNSLITQKNFGNKTTNLFLKRSDKVSATKTENTNGEHKSFTTATENKHKGFYIGGAIAPELTSVKLQPAKKSFDIGLLLGYNLNKKLSIELGFMLAQKYYYTSGKYVVPNSIGPQDSKILTLNAFNSVTEMPLIVQYNLHNENNSRLFVSAGAVSYIVHKENYSYVYSKDGEEKLGRTLYNKASQNWFSNVQMSAGYERSFNKICNIRVEPYCRVPLKGIGISDVPVTSVGVNLALIKTIK